MLLLQRSHQELIDRSDDKIGQKRLLPAGKPLVNDKPAAVLVADIAVAVKDPAVILVQLRGAVGKPYRMRRPAAKAFRPFFKPGEYAV